MLYETVGNKLKKLHVEYEYSEKLNYQTLSEFEKYLGNLTEQSHILMKSENQSIKGCYFDIVRENEKWFVIILDSKLYGKV